jgi:calcineurin-like phosphoesterase family protein
VSDFFTSDTHFFHEKIIEYARRPFANASIMNEVLIHNWNSVVGMTDRVFHCGDFIVGLGKNDPEAIYQRLNGQIFLIRGNHERAADKHKQRFEWIKDYYEYDRHGIKIVLFHYAQRIWNASHHGSWHLYGHSHGDMPDRPYELCFDVGVDCWNFTPLSLDQVSEVMARKKAAQIAAKVTNLESGHHGRTNDIPDFGRPTP